MFGCTNCPHPSALLATLLVASCLVSCHQAAAARSKMLHSGLSTSAAALFCTNQGGTVANYTLFNGDQPTGGVQLSAPMAVCSFPNEAKTNVYLVSLDTLASTVPTLAVLAFKARVPYRPPVNTSASTDPSTVYCIQNLGGAAAAGMTSRYLPIPTAPVGWWTIQAGAWYGSNDFCVFPDGSSMDTWTLFYHCKKKSDASMIKFAYNATKAG